jgi:hypothetical protein
MQGRSRVENCSVTTYNDIPDSMSVQNGQQLS